MTRMAPPITPDDPAEKLVQLNLAVQGQDHAALPSPYSPDPSDPPRDWPQHLTHLTTVIEELKTDRELLRDSINHLIRQLDQVMTQVQQMTHDPTQQPAAMREPAWAHTWARFTSALADFRDWVKDQITTNPHVQNAAGHAAPWMERLADYLTRITAAAARFADTLQRVAAPTSTSTSQAVQAPTASHAPDPIGITSGTSRTAQRASAPADDPHATTADNGSPSTRKRTERAGGPFAAETNAPATRAAYKPPNGMPNTQTAAQDLLSIRVGFPTPKPGNGSKKESSAPATPPPPAARPPRRGPQV